MSAYEEPPMPAGPFSMLASIFAVPLTPIPRLLRGLRTFAGANPLKWVVVALAIVGYAVAIVVYAVFALFPALSYVLLVLLTLPLTIAVYTWKGIVHVLGTRERRSVEVRTSTTNVRPAVGRGRAA
jgi:hypothetical protein